MRTPRVSRGRRKYKVASKKEKAEVKALSNLGHTNYAISMRTGFDPGAVKKYLADQEAYNDPTMAAQVAAITEKEILDLTVLTVKARARLHEIADRMNPIEALALMDRTFQQRRLLEGKATANIATISKLVKEANSDLEE